MSRIISFLNRNVLRRGRLQTRLTALILVIAAPLLIGVTSLLIVEARHQMETDADERLHLLNRTLTTNTTTWLDLNIRALTELISLPEIISMDVDQQKPLLEAMHNAYPHMYLVSTTDLNGMNVARNDAEAPKDYSDRYWFQNARDGAPITYQTLVGRTTGEPALVISTPIRNAAGEIVGVGMFAADLTDVTKEANISRIGDTGFAFLVDSNNQVLAHPDPELTAALVDFTADPPVKAARSGKTGLMKYTDEDGVKWRAYVSELDNGWIVAVQQKENELLSALFRFQQIALIALTVGLGLLFLLSWFTIRQAIAPVAALTATATAISQGELHRTAPVVSEDEIGVLAQAFNSMTDQLRGLIGSLEQRVAARTRDLNIASNVSRQITTELNLDNLLRQVVQLTAKEFGYYATSVFLLDEKQNALAMVAGAGAQGEIPIPSQPAIPLGADPSIIARAARTGEPVNVPDVRTSPAFLYMPEFPDTKSELAIPMVLGEHIVGVFDVQSEKPNRFGGDDLTVLTTLAEQIAIAVRNAQLFAEAEQARVVAENANSVKSEFLAAMSHELRTPLNGILNFTQFVATGMMGPVNDRQKELLNKATANGEHLLSLINDVLDISKIESGSLKLFMQPNIDVQHILDEVVATGQSMLQGKPVALVTNIDEDLPTIMADARRIRQILLNLVSNACKFTEEGRVTLTAHCQHDELLFMVKDTGPGIAPEEQATVFEVFGQTQVGLKRGEGIGLGMPISKRLAEALGGRLWLESAPGSGSTFYVSLPVQGNPPHIADLSDVADEWKKNP